ncbi:NlpC/P60 family protein [Streptomyces xinghaiensis]|uniref:C40 family peptidase n=1 Tax=Streptomyces xinghaiensis TaxID=1038928 RepID=UPI001EDCF4D7|nr:bifunctional lytic transglycosylase/C40 family peptidase [Streptomyces xinghaiensis]
MSAVAAFQAARQDGSGLDGTAADIPARMLTAYKRAVTLIGRESPGCSGMRWPVLAGIAKIESNHAAGRSVSTAGDVRPRILGPRLDGSGAGGNTTAFPDSDRGRWDGDAAFERAVGPFQFLPSTWAGSGRDGNGDGRRDPHNADDAALGAAVYLCGDERDLGDRGELEAALYAYNRSRSYVADVLSWIDQYTPAPAGASPVGLAAGKVRTVLRAALAQRGLPYSWGGGTADGPATGSCCSPSGRSGERIRGFDCSGLTTYAFAQVGIPLPRTADAQAGVGRRIPAAAGLGALRPGDLVFFGYLPGSDASIHHVGIYLGNGRMINAPRPGTVVRIDPVNSMPGYAGGARLL